MNRTNLTCIECPLGCSIDVETEGASVLSVQGNGCPRGKAYAESEVVCPRRVLTSTVRAKSGEMIPVKTARPVKKAEMFELMQKINGVHPVLPVRIGDVLYAHITEDIDLIATGNVD